MDILVDENIPLMSVKQLQQMGHNVLDIRSRFSFRYISRQKIF